MYTCHKVLLQSQSDVQGIKVFGMSLKCSHYELESHVFYLKCTLHSQDTLRHSYWNDGSSSTNQPLYFHSHCI